jgi:hypothetical protein
MLMFVYSQLSQEYHMVLAIPLARAPVPAGPNDEFCVWSSLRGPVNAHAEIMQ